MKVKKKKKTMSKRQSEENEEASDNDTTTKLPLKSSSNFCNTTLIKKYISTDKNEILAIFSRNHIPLTSNFKKLLTSNSQALFNLLTNNKQFKLLHNHNVLHIPSSSTIHFSKLLSALSLSTLRLFQWLLRSKINPKRFLKSEKNVISKVLKNSKKLSSENIPSNKIRSLYYS